MQEVLLERLQSLVVLGGQCEDLLEARPPDLPRQHLLQLNLAALEAVPMMIKICLMVGLMILSDDKSFALEITFTSSLFNDSSLFETLNLGRVWRSHFLFLYR